MEMKVLRGFMDIMGNRLLEIYASLLDKGQI